MSCATPGDSDVGVTSVRERSPASPETRAPAPLYAFDCRRADGSPICLEVHELGSDARALAWARKLLAEHLTCWSIEVFEGERLVGVVTRQAGRRERSRPTGA